MYQEELPAWPDAPLEIGYEVPYETLVRLGYGDAKAGRRRLRLLLGVETAGPKNGPTAQPKTVRSATVADEAGILALLRIDLHENPDAPRLAPIDDGRLLEFIHRATRKHLAVIGVIDGKVPGEIVGMTYLSLAQFFWSQSWVVEERVTTVHPDHRRSRHATNLLKFGCWFVDDMTARMGSRVMLIGAVQTMQRGLAKEVLFARHLNRVGSNYLYPSIYVANVAPEAKIG